MNTDRIRASIERNPGAPNHRIAKNLKLTVAEVAAVRATMETVKPAAATPLSGGVTLTGLRVLPRRPAESAAVHIKRLPCGRGFEPRVLAQEWGMSEDTIRRHAKDLKCLKYVEVSPDEWVPMVMSPETAKQYGV